jgi:hypothetical protein
MVAGFYSNYHLAKQGVLAGNILINGVVVKNINMTIGIGDLISTLNNDAMSKLNIDGLLIHSGTIFVKAIPNFVTLTLSTLSQEMFCNYVSETLLDPMTH